MFYQAKDSRVLDGDEWLSVDVALLYPFPKCLIISHLS